MKSRLAIVVLIIMLMTVLCGIAFGAGNNTEKMYEEGMALFAQKEYVRAFARFQISGEINQYAPSLNMLGICYRDGLGTDQNDSEALKYFRLSADLGYAPAADNLESMEENHSERFLGDVVSVGSYISFGTYEQDNDLNNGQEPIEWLVLEIKEGKALVISRYALDYQKYDSGYKGTWKNSSLRTWMNGKFLNEAFESQEQTKIYTALVESDKNPLYSTYAGGQTMDKVFLLSASEAELYFNNDNDRQCKPTEFALAKGCYVNSDGNCWWWLRTTGGDWYYTVGVHYSGAIGYGGNHIYYYSEAVRPADWVNLDS